MMGGEYQSADAMRKLRFIVNHPLPVRSIPVFVAVESTVTVGVTESSDLIVLMPNPAAECFWPPPVGIYLKNGTPTLQKKSKCRGSTG